MEEIFVTDTNADYFFGYYDVCPFDSGDHKLLSHKSNFPSRSILKCDKVELGYWVLESDEYVPFAETGAFNWQQGARLQWLNQDEIIFNNVDSNKYVSQVYDIKSGAVKTLPYPVYSIDAGRKYAICINHERHFWYRKGYSYSSIQNPKWKQPFMGEDGITLLDLEDGNEKLIIKLKDVYDKFYQPSMDDAVHILEHLLFNPDQKHFSFFHKWTSDSGQVYSNVILGNVENDKLNIISSFHGNSHYIWKDSENFLIWTQPNSIRGKVNNLPPIIKASLAIPIKVYRKIFSRHNLLRKNLNRGNFILFNTMTGDRSVIDNDVILEDGHPSYHPDQDLILCDTYSNKDLEQELYIYNSGNNAKRSLGMFKTLPGIVDTDYRCDLHPRWSNHGKFVCIDSCHTGKRAIHVFDVQDEINQLLDNSSES